LLLTIPFIAGNMKRVKRDKALKEALTALDPAAGLSFSQSEVWNDIYAIGIDTDKQKVAYIKKNGDSQQEIMADLREASDCRVEVTSRTGKTSNGSVTVVDGVSLVITSRDKALSQKRMEFYNSDIDPLLGSEKELADKWQAIVSSAIKKGHK
jgi:hypothetical protein